MRDVHEIYVATDFNCRVFNEKGLKHVKYDRKNLRDIYPDMKEDIDDQSQLVVANWNHNDQPFISVPIDLDALPILYEMSLRAGDDDDEREKPSGETMDGQRGENSSGRPR